MKAVVLGLGAMVAISVLAWIVTGTQTTTSGEAFVSPNNSVRVN